MTDTEQKKDWFWPWVGGAGVLLIAGGIGLYFLRGEDPAVAPAVPAATPTVAEPAPLPAPPAAPLAPPRTVPLPALDASDVDVLGALTELLGQKAVADFVVPTRLVRNIVVTIDNAPRQQMVLNQRPLKPTPGDFLTAGPDEAIVLAPENYARYQPFIGVVRSLDAKTLVALFRGLEPLFQQAYEELGHPNERFDARLVAVIEHLLDAPTVRGEIRLVQPSVLYRYADEEIEKLSAGHKLLIRMGADNAAVVKAKLREIQAELL